MPSVIINIAGRDTQLANGTTSATGHMWYSLNDGNGNITSYGFSPDAAHEGWPIAPGAVHHDDNTNYQTRDYVKIVEISQDQYDAMKNFGDNPASNGFTDYNGLTRSCIDFTWAGLKAGGLTDGYQGNVWPTWNADDVDAALRASNGLFDDLLRKVFNPAVAQAISDAFTGARSVPPPRIDPLILDLNGNGIETVAPNAANPILFDHNGDGIKTGTGWVAATDGFLVLDRNGNGTIDNGTELFGDSTALAAGGTAANGFAALAGQDTNADGVVNALDANFANLQVWQDLNQDGVSQAGELKTLTELGIVSLNLAKTANSQTLAGGNQIADLGSFVRADGTTAVMADVNLAADAFHRSFTDVIPTNALTATLPDMQGSGMVRDLRQAASLTSVEGAALAGALGQFATATRTDQLAQIDTLLADWAANDAGFEAWRKA